LLESAKPDDEKPDAKPDAPAGDSERPSAASAAAPPLLPPSPTGEVATLPLSPALRVLMRHLDGFVCLMQKRQFKKGAILYQLIEHSIKNFDPRFFLPSLFGPFYAQLAKQGAPLKSQLTDSPDFTVAALTELCRVDLELFMQMDFEE
jgi:hypothetical protein